MAWGWLLWQSQARQSPRSKWRHFQLFMPSFAEIWTWQESHQRKTAPSRFLLMKGSFKEAAAPRLVFFYSTLTAWCKGHCCTTCSVQTVLLPTLANSLSNAADQSFNTPVLAAEERLPPTSTFSFSATLKKVCVQCQHTLVFIFMNKDDFQPLSKILGSWANRSQYLAD